VNEGVKRFNGILKIGENLDESNGGRRTRARTRVRRKDRHGRKFGVLGQAFKESLTALAGEKESFFDAQS
jgi:hypothetical protein